MEATQNKSSIESVQENHAINSKLIAAQNYINSSILKASKHLKYTVSTNAPSSYASLIQCPSLVIWNGESDQTIFNDSSVNYAFRAIHDQAHKTYRINFNPINEIELGRIQASLFNSDLLRELVYCEIAEQAKYYLKNGVFVPDQKSFTLSYLTSKGVL